MAHMHVQYLEILEGSRSQGCGGSFGAFLDCESPLDRSPSHGFLQFPGHRVLPAAYLPSAAGPGGGLSSLGQVQEAEQKVAERAGGVILFSERNSGWGEQNLRNRTWENGFTKMR